ncbi:MAG TPA: hypothetical protein VLJ57_02805 [Burkholderiaceae bacterium]|nr:hypothetical protein [Burkholderiaceae bacterium]
MTRPTRPTDPASYRSSFQSFGELSRFLREAVTDDESYQLREGMRAVALQLEAAVAGSSLQHADRAVMGARLAALQTLLREHFLLVKGLSPAWRKLYEYTAYLAALQHFLSRIDVWLRDLSEPNGPRLWFGDFELLSWRTLGEGVMLLDTYEQWGVQDPESVPAEQGENALWQPAKWWRRLLK